MAHWVERAWQADTPASWLLQVALRPAAVLYGAGVAWRNRGYDRGTWRSTRVAARVIGVGNLTVGGSGKTPTALWLAQRLQARGARVAIVARGYGKKQRGVVVVSRGEGPLVSARDGGDEAVMLAHRFRGPIITGEQRVDAAQAAIAHFGVDTIVLDDGFQHRALARDADLLLLPPRGMIDRLLPAGAFREPWSSAARATAYLAVGDAAAPPADIQRPLFRATLQPECLLTWSGSVVTERPLTELAGRRVTVMAGIARPERVAAMVRALGAEVTELIAFPDHHDFTAADEQRLGVAAARGSLVCTEKDAVKLTNLTSAGSLHALRIGLVVTDGEHLLDHLSGAPA